jgi:hypothetical protein
MAFLDTSSAGATATSADDLLGPTASDLATIDQATGMPATGGLSSLTAGFQALSAPAKVAIGVGVVALAVLLFMPEGGR